MKELERRHEESVQGAPSIAPRMVSGPSEPTPEERAAHELLHVTRADWCEACVRGNETTKPHKTITFDQKDTGKAQITLDFCYMKADGEWCDDEGVGVERRPHGCQAAIDEQACARRTAVSHTGHKHSTRASAQIGGTQRGVARAPAAAARRTPRRRSPRPFRRDAALPPLSPFANYGVFRFARCLQCMLWCLNVHLHFAANVHRLKK